MIFSDVQIKLMQDSITSAAKRESVIWKSAFKFYNQQNAPKLFMSGPACYPKVLRYIIANNSKETVNIVPNDSRTGHEASK